MRVAVVHDWLESWRGGERVLAEILRLYPKADLFALVDFLPDADRKALLGKRATTSFIQNIPFAETQLSPLAASFPARDRVARSFLVRPGHIELARRRQGRHDARGQVHICYCFTPMRYAWDLREQYLRQTGLDRGLRGMLVRPVLSRLRAWDRAASARVDYFIAISRHIADRIRRCYDRESTVIYPPVAVDAHCELRAARRSLRDRFAAGALQAHRPDRAGLRDSFPSIGW